MIWRGMLLLFLLPCATLAKSTVVVDLNIDRTGLIDKKAVLENISLYRLRKSTLLSEQYVKRLYQKGITEIRTALQTFSYYQPKIAGRLIADNNATTWNVIYTVQLGPSLPLRRIDISILGEGENDKSIRRWLEDYPLKVNDPLIHETYEQAKTVLLRLLRDRGYFHYVLEKHQIRVNLKDYHADITLTVNTGPRYVFGNIEYEQRGFSIDYLKRFLPFKQGDPFESSKLQTLQRNFVNSAQFDVVEIEPKINATSGSGIEIPIQIRLTLKKRTRYAFGLGFGTDTGARSLFNIDRRYVNKKGHRMGLETLASRTKVSARLNYHIPLTEPANDYLTYSASRIIEDTDSAYRQTNSVALNVTHLFRHWRQSLGVSYETERFEVGIDSGKSELLIPSITWQYAPNPIKNRLATSPARPLSGKFNITIKGASSFFVSDVSFAQTLMNIKLRLRLTAPLSLVSRAAIGISSIPEFEELPASLRFFAGGDQSIRGFQFNSLGPTDDNGETIGGENLLVGSLELQHKIAKNWDIAAFIDAGNAFDNRQLNVEQGLGLGAGWRFPFGTLRLYAANAFSTEDRPWRFHLLVGAEI